MLDQNANTNHIVNLTFSANHISQRKSQLLFLCRLLILKTTTFTLQIRVWCVVLARCYLNRNYLDLYLLLLQLTNFVPCVLLFPSRLRFCVACVILFCSLVLLTMYHKSHADYYYTYRWQVIQRSLGPHAPLICICFNFYPNFN